MIASGILRLQGLLYKYGQPHFTNNIAFRWTFSLTLSFEAL
jgi:hypothetical protein